MPPTVLKLKIGCVVMLLKNLCPHRGLCNGTRMIVTNVSSMQLTGTLLGGQKEELKGGAAAADNNGANNDNEEEITIPRCRCTADPADAGITFHRTQLPFVLAFATTINKAQGQTLSKMGLDVSSRQCFAHGQLYVALSRVKHMDDIAIACQVNSKDGTPLPVVNPVYRDVLQEVSGDVEGIFSNLTEEEKDDLRREYSLNDKVYSDSVHAPLVPPSAQHVKDNAALPMSCGHVVADQPWDLSNNNKNDDYDDDNNNDDDYDDDSSNEDEEDYGDLLYSSSRSMRRKKALRTTTTTTHPTSPPPAKRRRKKTCTPRKRAPPPPPTHQAKRARTQTKKEEGKEVEEVEEVEEILTKAQDVHRNHNLEPAAGHDWVAIDMWLHHRFPDQSYTRVGIVGDGTCFFYSVSLGLPHTPCPPVT